MLSDVGFMNRTQSQNQKRKTRRMWIVLLPFQNLAQYLEVVSECSLKAKSLILTMLSLKVWDLRKTKESLKVFEELPNNYGQTNIGFTYSPDEQLFFTGTSVERDSATRGLLCFFDRL
ncbi:uncharacterized protein LOC123887030 [Trifolium pratense]|uniref:Uncharacterized protein n=1 Tax=Trifolium pratense TaxID=57577 RepID=A0ACB0L7E3_TRIPR|nr:uncharacterized protein LOC123887030 [Trifolium pratense]CAJ2664263.1 unnamed protein product [Trifolium pratense]